MWYRYAKKESNLPLSYSQLEAPERMLYDKVNAQPPTQYSYSLPTDASAQNHYFISDLHFNDPRKANNTGIIPPGTSDRRTWINNHIINQWNQKVRPKTSDFDGDHVWMAGDYGAFKSEEEAKQMLGLLNGNKHLILGNHDLMFDSNRINRDTYNANLFDTVDPHAMINFQMPDGTVQPIYLKHINNFFDYSSDNSEPWPGQNQNTIMGYGHTHGFHDDRPHEKSLDLGASIYNFSPITLNNILSLMSQKNPNRKRIPYEQFKNTHQRNLWNLSDF